MKCPYCGAEANGSFCEYCGSELPKEEPKVEIVNNYYNEKSVETSTKATCPHCGSSNITFKREKSGLTTSGKRKRSAVSKRHSSSSSSTSYQYRNIGFCKDCGYSWTKSSGSTSIWLWVIGFLFCWPLALVALLYKLGVFDKKVPSFTIKNTTIESHTVGWWTLRVLLWPVFLSIWFYKSDKIDLEKKYKIAAIVTFWIGLPLVSVAIWLFKTEKVKLEKKYRAIISGILVAISIPLWIFIIAPTPNNNSNNDVNSNVAYIEETTIEETTIEETTTYKTKASQTTTTESTTEEHTIVELTTEEPATEEKTTATPTTAEKVTEAQKTAAETTEKNNTSEKVWITSSGKKYHSNQYCSNMKNPTQVDISCVGNRTPCGKCY